MKFITKKFINDTLTALCDAETFYFTAIEIRSLKEDYNHRESFGIQCIDWLACRSFDMDLNFTDYDVSSWSVEAENLDYATRKILNIYRELHNECGEDCKPVSIETYLGNLFRGLLSLKFGEEYNSALKNHLQETLDFDDATFKTAIKKCREGAEEHLCCIENDIDEDNELCALIPKEASIKKAAEERINEYKNNDEVYNPVCWGKKAMQRTP